jgi:deoxyribose-phosphate aldolase
MNLGPTGQPGMEFTLHKLAGMVDLTAVRADTDEAQVKTLARVARQYQCIYACTLPAHTPLLRELLADEPGIGVVGAVGFPSGGHTTAIKVAEARELIEMGCSELDMVMNIGLLRSGRYGRVRDDVRAVVDAAGQIPVKVILECHYLSDDQILRGCDACVEAQAAFIKTSTGWAPTGARAKDIALIKSHVGDAIRVKAAGGIRSLEELIEMYRLGARRFGLGVTSAVPIFEACARD